MIIANIIAAFQRWVAYRNTVAELSRLDDRSLSDLGINRCDIDQIARGATIA